MAAKLQFYRDRQRQHRWRFYAKNGRILAESGEGYNRIASAEKGWDAVCDALQGGGYNVERLFDPQRPVGAGRLKP